MQLIIAEGFAIINPILRRRINHTNRTQHSKAIFHSYSRLLDFEHSVIISIFLLR
jgi:hypothetical protein